MTTEKKPHSARAWIVFLILFLAVAALVYFFAFLPRHRREETIGREARQREQEKPIVKVQAVRRAPAVSELLVPGTATAYTQASIYARASGYVSRRFADIGDHVHAGQLLAIVDAPDLDRQVAQARSTLQQSESNLAQMEAQLHLQALNWERYKVLVAKGVFSRQQGDQQEADYRVADANVQAAKNTVQANRDNLDRLLVLQGYERVTAPFSGLITDRNVDVGTLISATGSGEGIAVANPSSSAAPSTGGSQGGEMFGIADIGRLRLFVSVPEAYSAAIRVGERAQLSFQELANEKFEGRVTRTSSSIDQNTRTLLVEVQVPNLKGRLLPGMYVLVNFVDVEPERPLMVPGEAIVVRNARSSVALVRNDCVQFVPVAIGRDYGDQVEILSGLHEGDVIAVTITDDVHDGAQIQPQYPKEATPEASGGQNGQTGQGGQYGDQSSANSAQQATKKQSGSKRQ